MTRPSDVEDGRYPAGLDALVRIAADADALAVSAHGSGRGRTRVPQHAVARVRRATRRVMRASAGLRTGSPIQRPEA
jgi:hypothetical protein